MAKDEAFELWTREWETLYEPSSESARLIRTMRQNYYLVNVVDNDFVNGDLYGVLVG